MKTRMLHLTSAVGLGVFLSLVPPGRTEEIGAFWPDLVRDAAQNAVEKAREANASRTFITPSSIQMLASTGQPSQGVQSSAENQLVPLVPKQPMPIPPRRFLTVGQVIPDLDGGVGGSGGSFGPGGGVPGTGPRTNPHPWNPPKSWNVPTQNPGKWTKRSGAGGK